MTRIPLSIDTGYLPDWGVAEGLRELVQNWLDARDVGDTPDTHSIDHAADRLTLANPGARLDRSALLLGVTSKRGVEGQRGQFGEGLKLGTLALVRAGKSVSVEAGGERWTATITAAPEFGDRPVLGWDVEPSDAPSVSIHVGGVSDHEWSDARRMFRALDLTPRTAIETSAGALLRDAADVGNVYVKGILVCHDASLTFGYDLLHAAVDRDRRLIRDFDLRWETSRVASEALRRGLPVGSLFSALEDGRKDLGYLANHIAPEQREALAARFRERHGADALPVSEQHDAEALAHAGRRGIIVSEAMVNVLAPVLGTVADAVRAAGNAPAERYALADLTDEERDAYEWALAEVATVADMLSVQVVRYPSPSLMGRYVPGVGVEIARAVLADRFETLATLIHEVAHRAGGDGDAGHVRAMERIWTDIARRWIAGRVEAA
jgi:hypothetical protein